MSYSNPRFPHTFRVLRATRDINGEIVFDASGNPTYTATNLQLFATFGGKICRTAEGTPIPGDIVTNMPFGYRTSSSNTSDKGDAVVKGMELHCPPFYTTLHYDDIIEVTDYDRTYKARMVKKYTNNFGSAVWIDEIEN